MTPKRLNLIRFKSNDKLPSSAEPHVVVVARSHVVPHSIEKKRRPCAHDGGINPLYASWAEKNRSQVVKYTPRAHRFPRCVINRHWKDDVVRRVVGEDEHYPLGATCDSVCKVLVYSRTFVIRPDQTAGRTSERRCHLDFADQVLL